MKINVIRFRVGSTEDFLLDSTSLFSAYVIKGIDETTGKTVYEASVKKNRNSLGFHVGKSGGCFTTYNEAEECAVALLPIREAEWKAECEAYAEQARNFLKGE